jgi:hypothetical protein
MEQTFPVVKHYADNVWIRRMVAQCIDPGEADFASAAARVP